MRSIQDFSSHLTFKIFQNFNVFMEYNLGESGQYADGRGCVLQSVEVLLDAEEGGRSAAVDVGVVRVQLDALRVMNDGLETFALLHQLVSLLPAFFRLQHNCFNVAYLSYKTAAMQSNVVNTLHVEMFKRKVYVIAKSVLMQCEVM